MRTVIPAKGKKPIRILLAGWDDIYLLRAGKGRLKAHLLQHLSGSFAMQPIRISQRNRSFSGLIFS